MVDALLYNREELLSILQLPSSALISDEALLLQLIRQKGFDSLSAVNGDFAGAIYDPAAGCWKLFRDHLGVRPLYVYHDDRIFAFSTDIRGIASIPGVDLRPNELQLFTSFMNCNPLTMQQTDFASIRCALPGAWTTVTRGAGGFVLEERPYWKLRSRKLRLSSVEEYEHRLRELVADAVKRRLDAVPGLIGEEPFHFFTKPYRYVLQGGTRDRLENAAFQGASAGVRYLFPFVDHRVMDFAVSIPRHLYVSNRETRVIYRNAFADLMPESLRRVSYKAMVSLRHIGSRNMDHDAYVINREYIVNKLDPEYWRGILDLEAIACREQPQDPASDEARAFRADTHMLYRCILIQNTTKLAKDWRTIHDRTDLL